MSVEANAVNMDIFDEVDLESSQMDEQLLAFSLPLKTQNATPAGLRQPKAIRRKVDEVPLGADSGETRTCTSWPMSLMVFLNHDKNSRLPPSPQVQRLRMLPQRLLFPESAISLPLLRSQS